MRGEEPEDLTRLWRELWTALPSIGDGGALFRELLQKYSESHRKYHNLQHLEECLQLFVQVRHLAQRPLEVELAIWFHDAVYDVRRGDNEKKSADWAESAATELGMAEASAARIHELIMATRHQAVPEDGDAQLLVDIDLAILGAETERFEEYEEQVRAEYSWVPKFLFRRNRRKVLRSFLNRPRIYSTDHFCRILEARARDNLRRSLERLGG